MATSELIVLEKPFHEDQPIGGRAVFALGGNVFCAHAAAAQHKVNMIARPVRVSAFSPSNMNPPLLLLTFLLKPDIQRQTDSPPPGQTTAIQLLWVVYADEP
jgi:hypothetical protein